MGAAPRAAWCQWSTNGGSIYYNGGAVGIGTASPSSYLHLFSTADNVVLTLESQSSAAYPRLLLKSYTRQWEATSGGSGASSGLSGAFYIYDRTYGGLTGVRLLINPSGYVGIGTTTPSHQLQVAGTIGAEEVLVTSTGAD